MYDLAYNVFSSFRTLESLNRKMCCSQVKFWSPGSSKHVVNRSTFWGDTNCTNSHKFVVVHAIRVKLGLRPCLVSRIFRFSATPPGSARIRGASLPGVSLTLNPRLLSGIPPG
jgi:hypothetical protein